MKHLDLFSGIGGFALAARNVGWETVAFCEPDAYCQAVLRKHWPDVPIFDDVRTLDVSAVGHVDIITGGYPCQPFSLAGKRGGADDDRHLWPAMFTILQALRPAWVVGENVAGHVTMGLDDVLSDLERAGYSCRPLVIPAVAVDARHRRDRVWIVAHASGTELRQQSGRRSGTSRPGSPEPRNDGAAKPLADDSEHGRGTGRARRSDPSRSREPEQALPAVAGSDDARRSEQRRGQPIRSEQPAVECGSRWSPEPNVDRVANGIPNRVDRLRALGNAIVPQVAEEIFRAIGTIQ